MATTEWFQSKQVSYKHKNISKTGDAPEWYKQLDSSAELIEGSYQKSHTTCFIYNPNQKIDEPKSFPCIKIISPCKIQFNGFDVENYYVYIKFYSVVINWKNNESNGPRLVYSTIGKCMRNHEYGHPEAVLLDNNGIGTFPAGDYGFRGWEIVLINKIEQTITDAFKYTKNRQTYNYFPRNIDFFINNYQPSSNLKAIKVDDAHVDYAPSIKSYYLPFLNFRGHPVYAYGYYGSAIDIDEDKTRYQTSNSVSPFNSNRPKQWNFTGEPILLYSGDSLVNDTSIHTFVIQTNSQTGVKELLIDGIKENRYRPDDKIIFYVRKPGTVTTKDFVPLFERSDGGNFPPRVPTNSGIVNYYHRGDPDYWIACVQKSFQSVHNIDFSNMSIIQMKDNTSVSINHKTLPVGDLIDSSNKKYLLYSSIISKKSFTHNLTYSQPTSDTTKHYASAWKPAEGAYLITAVVDNIQAVWDGNKESDTSTWSGTYTAQLKFNNVPYIDYCNHILSSDYSPIETVAKVAPDVLSITMKGIINDNTTAGMLDTNIVGNPTNSVNIVGSPTNSIAKIGYDVNYGTNYAIWVVLWHV